MFNMLIYWKHYTSPWHELSEASDGAYKMDEYPKDEFENTFPEYDEEELLKYLTSIKREDCYNFERSVEPSRITIRIIGIDKNNKNVIRVINFWLEFGY